MRPKVQRQQLLAHRGLWNQAIEANSATALTMALEAGFGIETDLRDYLGEVVVSHDPPQHASQIFSELMSYWMENGLLNGRVLALNIKSDGLLTSLSQIKSLARSSHFFFDLSFPQLLEYAKADMPVSLRISEFEAAPIQMTVDLDIDKRFVIDGFNANWWIGDDLIEELVEVSQCTVISPEIHGRNPITVWDWFSQRISAGCDLLLCTDSPFDVLDRIS